MGEIKSTDLRAGNLVLHNKQIFEIYDIISTQDSLIIGQGDDTGGLQEVFISEIEPIQLTEAVLFKCGFIKLDEKHNFYICDCEINLKIDKKIIWVAWHNTVLTNVELKHLHQLQNLYFALTGQELKIEL